MRASALTLLFVVTTLGCSSSEGTAPAASSSGSAKPAVSVTKSAAPALSASAAASASAAPSASAAVPSGLRDADTELKTLDPFGAGGDGAQKFLTALTLCGDQGTATTPWGRDPAAPTPPPKVEATRCNASMHGKLLLKSASMLADSKDANNKKTATEHVALALALDPAAELPTDADAATKALFTAAKKRKPLEARVGAVTTSDEPSKSELEKAVGGEVSSAVRFCYTIGLFNNPNLQGRLTIAADVGADGQLSAASVTGDLPDQGVLSCVGTYVNRSKVNAPSKAPTKISVPFILNPAGI